MNWKVRMWRMGKLYGVMTIPNCGTVSDLVACSRMFHAAFCGFECDEVEISRGVGLERVGWRVHVEAWSFR